MTQTAKTGVAMHNFNFFSYDDIPEDWEKGKDSGHCRFSIDDEEGNVVDLEAIGKIANPSPTLVSMGDDDYLMTAVDEFGR